jgi:uncharacterized membrane protein
METTYESLASTFDQPRPTGFDNDADRWPAAYTGPKQNVGDAERKVSITAGAIASAFGLARRDIPGLVIAAIGGGLIYRGATGHCHAYEAMGVDTAKDSYRTARSDLRQHGVHVVETFTIDKPADELYQFWRNLENLPAFMSYLESVRVLDDRRSHWVATAPKIVGGSVEWDAEITEDQPNSRIAWHSLPESEIANRGSVEFKAAPGNRGTIVRVELEYNPPAGQVGAWLAKLFGNDPESLIREDLRNFKRIMEIGDILTIEGQPRGACAGGIGRILGN